MAISQALKLWKSDGSQESKTRRKNVEVERHSRSEMQNLRLECTENREFHGLGRPARALGNTTTPLSHLTASKSTRIDPFPFVAHVNLRHGDDDSRHHGRWLRAGQNSGWTSSARYQYMPEAEELREAWSARNQRAAQGCRCFVHLRCSRDVRYSCGCCWINICVVGSLDQRCKTPLPVRASCDSRARTQFPLVQGRPSLQNSRIRILHVPLALSRLLWIALESQSSHVRAAAA